MPYEVEHRPIKSSNKDYAVVNKETNRIKGRTTSRQKARAMVRAIYANKKRK